MYSALWDWDYNSDNNVFILPAAFPPGFASEKTGRKLVDRSWRERNWGFLCTCHYRLSPQWNHCSLAVAVGFNLQLFFFFFYILRTSFILTPQRCKEQPDVPLSPLLSRFSHVRLHVTPPGSSVHGFSAQECYSELPFPSPGDLPDPGIKSGSPALQADSLLLSHQRSLSSILTLSLSFLCPPPNLLLGSQH